MEDYRDDSWMDMDLNIHDPFELSLESPMDLYPNSFSENISQNSSFVSNPFSNQGFNSLNLSQPQLFQPQFPQQVPPPQQVQNQQSQQVPPQLFQPQFPQQVPPPQQVPQFQQHQFPPQTQFLQVKKEFEEIQTLDEEALVALDSDSFQDYVDQLRHRRALTRSEEMLFKKTFKKIKNRESARKSRQAKKEISQELDEQVHLLSQKTQSLKLEVSALTAVNQQIRNEISFSEKLIASNPFLSKLYNKTLAELNKPDNIVKLQMNENRCTFRSTTDFVSNNGVAVNS